jgi:hypothetical protein
MALFFFLKQVTEKMLGKQITVVTATTQLGGAE